MHYQSPTGSVQSISFTAPTSTQAGQTVALSATANSGLVVTFSSQTPAICSVSGTQVTTLAAGTCTIAADQAGDTTHWTAAPTVTQSFTVTSSGGGGGGSGNDADVPIPGWALALLGLLLMDTMRRAQRKSAH